MTKNANFIPQMEHQDQIVRINHKLVLADQADENRIVWFEPSNLRSAMWIRNDATNKEIKAATDTLLERGFLVPVQGNDNEHCARAISFEEIEQLGLFEPKEQNNAG